MNKESIRLFYWSEKNIRNKDFENYGDLLSKYLFEKLSGREVKWIQPRKLPWYRKNKRHYLGAGSIIHHGIRSSIIWGSGIISRDKLIPKAIYKAVRGPISRGMILKAGIDCPEVYGDPGLLLPKFFNPEIKKTHKIGIIPHHTEYSMVFELFKNYKEVKIINLETMDVEEITGEILYCEATISSSLHGLIASHAYGIPSKWVEFSKGLYGDGVKFLDYLESVNLKLYQPVFINADTGILEIKKLVYNGENLPDQEIVKNIQNKLIKAFPL